MYWVSLERNKLVWKSQYFYLSTTVFNTLYVYDYVYQMYMIMITHVKCV